jgi:hypothetical protein
MRNVAAVLLTALGMAAGVQTSAESIALIATGTIVSKAADALVVRTDDHGHRITFGVDGKTVLPDGLAVGRHVRIVYHATGTTGQTADEVTLVGRAPSRGGSGATQ